MLDSYEKGFDMETLDRFFDELKENIVPMLMMRQSGQRKWMTAF